MPLLPLLHMGASYNFDGQSLDSPVSRHEVITLLWFAPTESLEVLTGHIEDESGPAEKPVMTIPEGQESLLTRIYGRGFVSKRVLLYFCNSLKKERLIFAGRGVGRGKKGHT